MADIEKGNSNWGDYNYVVSGSGLIGKEVRIGFIRKVYLIVSAQLVFTFGICSIFVLVPEVKEFTRSAAGFYLYIISYLVYIILTIVFAFMSCTKGLRRYPYNYYLLFAFTCSFTYMLSMISAYHKTEAVFVAIGITLFITVGVTLFACQTKYDFTNCWLVLVCLTLAFFGFGIACGIVYAASGGSLILQAVYGGLGAIFMAIFLAVDTQLLMGNRQLAYSPEDYVNAALQIYLDICVMFLYILQMMSGGKK